MSVPVLPSRDSSNRQLSMVHSGVGLMTGKGLAMVLGFGYWQLGYTPPMWSESRPRPSRPAVALRRSQLLG